MEINTLSDGTYAVGAGEHVVFYENVIITVKNGKIDIKLAPPQRPISEDRDVRLALALSLIPSEQVIPVEARYEGKYDVEPVAPPAAAPPAAAPAAPPAPHPPPLSRAPPHMPRVAHVPHVPHAPRQPVNVIQEPDDVIQTRALDAVGYEKIAYYIICKTGDRFLHPVKRVLMTATCDCLVGLPNCAEVRNRPIVSLHPAAKH